MTRQECWLGAFLLVGVTIVHLWEPRTARISVADFQHIQHGMSREEVAELLGSAGETMDSAAVREYPHLVHGDTVVRWPPFAHSAVPQVYVGFVEGLMVSKYYYDPTSD